uniref:ATP-binding protein n=1 Tax=Ignisphaera aggregans TaxID=334771 RepID=A0A7C2V9Q6_9CREN
MREIGVIASNARSYEAPMIVYKDAEPLVKEELLVVIEDSRFDKRYLGVLRFVTKLDPLLTTSQRSAVIERPEIAEEGIDIPYEVSVVRIIGEIVNGGIEPPTTPPTPRSKVYIVESPTDLGIGLGSGLVVGVHKYSGIEIPMNPEALRYHVAVVGTTGTGKSRLVKALIDEVLAKTSWSVVVFDHTGMDYCYYWPNSVVKADAVVLDIDTITEGLKTALGSAAKLEDYMPFALLRYIACASDKQLCSQITQQLYSEEQGARFSERQLPVTRGVESQPSISRELVEELAIKVSSKGLWSAPDLAKMAANTSQMLGARKPTPQKLALYISLFATHYVKRLNNMSLRVDHLVERARRDRILVVDLSTIETEVRRVIVKKFLERLWEIVAERLEPINMLIVIDEAHNYACQYGCAPSNALIEKTLREGRKWGLGVVLASQRVMDFAPDVRNNINTVFFSRLQTPYDFDQLRGFVDLAGIRPEALSLLGTREFFFAGLGNPLRFPMLIRVREVGDPRHPSS